MKALDLTGAIFGELTVVARNGKDKYNRYNWRCACSCGKERVVQSNELMAGKTKSCGHLRHIGHSKKDLAGKVFGRLTVVSEAGRDKSGRMKWLCQCSCGNATVVHATNLARGHTTSCGCYARERASATMTTHGMSNTPEYKNMKGRKRKETEKKLDIEWTIEMESELSQYFQECVVCGKTRKLATDHVLPLHLGNGLKIGNATKLCIYCNSSKFTKMPDELSPSMRDKVVSSADEFKNYWMNLQMINSPLSNYGDLFV